MSYNLIKTEGINIVPIYTAVYVPPMLWKGDAVGHMGDNDVFFWVLEGECYIRVDSEYSVIKAGQLAFLPKGKMRAYTQVSETFALYEISFSATVGGENLMKLFGLTDGDYVVNIDDKKEMSALFEKSYRAEFNKNPLYDISFCGNILNIINIYCKKRQEHSAGGRAFFRDVVKYMEEHLSEQVRVEDLSAIVYMEPTYFIRKFKKEFGLPPLTYFIGMKMNKAMQYLSSTDLSVEEISRLIGINDVAYFSRLFKKSCNISPSEYRKTFIK